MKTIETNIHISNDRTLHLTQPVAKELKPGMYHVVMVIDEEPIQATCKKEKKPLKLNMLTLDAWPSDSTFRREDIYGDDGR